MAKNSGGPAFPVTITNQSRTPAPGLDNDEVVGGTSKIYGGMSLRDYFAAKAPITVDDAMVTLFLDSNFGTLAPTRRAGVMTRLAELRFEYADAMLAERAK